MIPNKKGLQVIMKNTFTPGWENRIFTLTGEKQINVYVYATCNTYTKSYAQEKNYEIIEEDI